MNAKEIEMTEKELLQAKHRQEEAEARSRELERKRRTRRLILHGAVLENVMPETVSMDGSTLERQLRDITQCAEAH